MVVSKKFWLTSAPVECAVLSASRVAKRECKSAEDSGHYSMHVSANNVTCFVGFPSRHQAYDHRNNEQHRDRDSDVERGEQTGDQTGLFRRCGGRRRCSRWRRCILFRKHRLRILQALESVIVLRVYL